MVGFFSSSAAVFFGFSKRDARAKKKGPPRVIYRYIYRETRESSRRTSRESCADKRGYTIEVILVLVFFVVNIGIVIYGLSSTYEILCFV